MATKSLFSARATGELVRRHAPEQERRTVGPGQAAVGQCAVHQAERTTSAWPSWWPSNWRSWASHCPRDGDAHLPRLCALLKDRCDTTVALADWVASFMPMCSSMLTELAQHVTDAVQAAHCNCWLRSWRHAPGTRRLLPPQSRKCWPQSAFEDAATGHAGACVGGGHAQTPSLDAVLELLREEVIARLG